MKWYKVGILLFTIGLTSCGDQVDYSSTEHYVKQAEDAYAKGINKIQAGEDADLEYDKLMGLLDKIQRINSDLYWPYEKRAMAIHLIQGRNGDSMNMLSNLNTAIQLNPERVAVVSYILRGSILEEQGEIMGAVRDYSTAIQRAPDGSESVQAYVKRAYIYGSQSNYSASLKDANKAISIHPAEMRAYLVKALVNKDMGNSERALEYIDIAIQLEPDNKILWDVKECIKGANE